MQVKIITDGHKQKGKYVKRNTVITVHDSVGEWLIAQKIAQKETLKTPVVKITEKKETE